MPLRKVINSIFAVTLLTIITACDVVPKAEDAAETQDDRSQFQAPKNVVTTSGDQQILIQWPEYFDATAYTLYWSSQNKLPSGSTQSVTISDTNFLHTGLTNGIPYYYALSAQTNRGDSSLSEIVTATPDYLSLPAPVLSPIIEGDKRNTLNWEAVSGATSYTIYWNFDSNAELSNSANRLASVVSPFVHENLNNKLQYNYRIVANNFEKEGVLSDVISGTPFQRAPMAPKPTALSYSGNSATISFTDVSNASSFDLYWSNSPNVDLSDQHIVKIQSPFIHTPLQPNRIYYYRLMAQNAGGQSALTREFSVNTAASGIMPDPALLIGPLPVTPGSSSISLSDRQMSLFWDNSDANTLGFNLYWKAGNGGVNVMDNKIANILPPYTLTGLENGVPIYYVLTAINNSGESTTTIEGLPAIPQIVIPGVPTQITAASGNSVVALSWATVAGASDYNAHWRRSDSASTDYTDTLSNISSPVMINTLSNGVDYTFAVSANNSSGQSNKSVAVTSTPQIQRPLAPSRIIAQPGESRIDLSWDHAFVGSQFITGFRVYWSGSEIISTASLDFIDVTGATTRSYSHQNLVNGRLLYYVITALNAGGESSLSAQIQAKPQLDIPNAPSQVSAIPGNAQVQVNWLQQTSVQKYNLYWWKQNGGNTALTKTVIANVSPGLSITNLDNGIAHHFNIASFNQAGESILSKEIIATPQIPAPTTVVAQFSVKASDASVQLFWSDVASAKNHRLYWSTSSNINATNSAFVDNENSGFTLNGLSNGRTYYFAVAGTNAGGEGPISTIISATPQIAPPNAPPQQFAVSSGNKEIIVGWKPASTTQNMDYNVYYTTDPSAAWTKMPGLLPGDAHKPLLNNTRYYYRIAAVNAGGESPFSTILSAIPQVAAPAAPNGLSVSVINDTQLAINWYQTPGLNYTLYWSNNPNVPITGASSNPILKPDAIYIHANLTPGSRYYYVITAQNPITATNPNPGAQSPASTVASAVPVAVSATAPANLNAVGANSKVKVQWHNISGANAISASYTLYWTDDSNLGPQLQSQFASANIINNVNSPYTHNGLINGRDYYYVVTATTGSESSPSAIAQTQPQQASVAPPTGIQLVGGLQQVSISWNMLAQINYHIYWTTSSNAPLTGTKISNVQSPYVHVGLADNTAITYVMTAQNATGESLASRAFTITPGSNTAPVITQNLEPPLNEVIVTMSEDSSPIPFILNLNAFDNEGDVLTWAISRPPTMSTSSALITGSESSATLSYTPESQFNGNDNFEVEVKDEFGASSTILVSINIEPVNDAPLFASLPTSTDAVVGLNFSYSISVSDIDNSDSELTISVVTKPDWLTFSLSSIAGQANLTGIPDINNIGSIGNNIVLQVSDLAGARSEQSFVLAVNNDNATTLASNSTVSFSSQLIAGLESIFTIQAIDTLGNLRTTGGDTFSVVVNTTNSLAVVDNSDGTYVARYTPTVVGNYNVVITLAGSPIQNSPFVTLVTPAASDVSQALVNAPSQGKVGIDTVITLQQRDLYGNNTAGGIVAGTINNGANTTAVFISSVDPTILGLSTLTYRPTFAGTDNIEISIDTLSLPNNPFISIVTPVAADPGKTIAVLPIVDGKSGFTSTINVQVKDANGNLTSGNLSASSTLTPGATVFSTTLQSDKSYELSYIPITAGNDTLAISVDGSPISNSPVSHLVLPGVAVVTKSTVMVPATSISGTPSVINITAKDINNNSSIGSDSVAVSIATGSANANATVSIAYVSNGNYTASYTPTLAGTDTFIISLNGNSFTPTNPFSSIVSSGGAVVANSSVSLPISVVSGNSAVLNITARDLGNNLSNGNDTITMTINGGSPNVNSTVTIAYTGNGVYSATYTPTNTGTDTFTVTLNGSPFTPASPYSTSITPDVAVITRSSLSIPATGISGTPTTISVTARDVNGNYSDGADLLTAVIDPGSANANLMLSFSFVGNGFYTASYTPVSVGTDTFSINLNGNAFTSQVPFSSNISSGAAVVSNSSVTVPASVVNGNPNVLSITVKDANNNLSSGNDIVTVIINPGSANINKTVLITYTGAGVYSASYTPTVAGTDTFTVALNGNPFTPTAPYRSNITTTAAVVVNSIVTVPAEGTNRVAHVMNITAKDSNGNLSIGNDTITMSLDTGSANVNAIVTIAYEGNGVFSATYFPVFPGTDTYTVTLNAEVFSPATPYSSNILAKPAIVANSTVFVPTPSYSGSPVLIKITAKDVDNLLTYGDDTVIVRIIAGSANVTATVTVAYTSKGEYIASYTPITTGIDSYTVELNNNFFMPASPFNTVIRPGSAVVAKSSVLVPATGVPGSPTSIVVTARDVNNNLSSGNDTVSVQINPGSANINASILVAYSNNGIYTATYTPSFGGTDTYTINLNGNPFTPTLPYNTVFATGTVASNTTASILSSITPGSTSNIDVQARDASGAPQTNGADLVVVSITGANPVTPDPIVVYAGNGIYSTSYVPTAVGTDTIVITINSSPIQGSPYLSTIIDINGSNAWANIGAGKSNQSLAVKLDGSLWAWGNNNNFELGDGTNVDKNNPIPISTTVNIASVYAGNGRSFAIDINGELWSWGNNFYGELGDNSTTRRTTPVQVYNPSAVKWLNMPAASMGIRVNGTLWIWGNVYYLPDGTTSARSSIPIQVGSSTNWAKLARGQSHNLALDTSGVLTSWGSNRYGELGSGNTPTGNLTQFPSRVIAGTWTDIAAGNTSSIAIKSDGTMWAWGADFFDQLGNGSAGNSNVPVQIGIDPSTNWVKVLAGADFYVALKSNGTLWAWGDNRYGKTGDGTGDNTLTPPNLTKPIPVQAGPDTDWVDFNVGKWHTIAIKSDNSIWSWGINSNGELGIGTITTNTYQNAPAPIP